MTKAVAKQSPQMPDYMKSDKSEGAEGIDSSDLAIPRLKLCQAMTPEVKDKIAEEGDLFHTIIKEVICKSGDKISAVIVLIDKQYILWRDRKDGGGIMARAKAVKRHDAIAHKWDKPNATFSHKIDGKISVDWKTKEYIEDDRLCDWGTSIEGDMDSPPAATLHYNYIIVLPDHNYEMLALSLSRTQIKKGKMLNTLLHGKSIYGCVVNISTKEESNQGNRYANYEFSPVGFVESEEKYLELQALHRRLKDVDISFDETPDHEPDDKF